MPGRQEHGYEHSNASDGDPRFPPCFRSGNFSGVASVARQWPGEWWKPMSGNPPYYINMKYSTHEWTGQGVQVFEIFILNVQLNFKVGLKKIKLNFKWQSQFQDWVELKRKTNSTDNNNKLKLNVTIQDHLSSAGGVAKRTVGGVGNIHTIYLKKKKKEKKNSQMKIEQCRVIKCNDRRRGEAEAAPDAVYTGAVERVGAQFHQDALPGHFHARRDRYAHRTHRIARSGYNFNIDLVETCSHGHRVP